MGRITLKLPRYSEHLQLSYRVVSSKWFYLLQNLEVKILFKIGFKIGVNVMLFKKSGPDI